MNFAKFVTVLGVRPKAVHSAATKHCESALGFDSQRCDSTALSAFIGGPIFPGCIT